MMCERLAHVGRLHLSLADFDIIRRIGEGSFAQVVHVRHKQTGKDFALKIVDKHLVVRYKQVWPCDEAS